MGRFNVFYFIKEGVCNLFKHGFMSFAAIGVTVACLLIMGTFTLVAVNANAMLKEMEEQNQILAFVDETLTEADARALEKNLMQVENVKQVLFISNAEAADAFRARYEEDELFQGIPDENFRHRFTIDLHDIGKMSETCTALELVEGVADVSAYEDEAAGFVTIRNVAGIVCVTLIAILFVVSVFIIANTIKLTTFDRRDEIAIMKMVGATNGFIRLPFIVEGFTLGMLGAAMAFGLEWVMYDAMVTKIAEVDALKLFTFVPFQQLLIPMIVTFAATGMFVGVVGSWTAIRKFMNV